MFPLLTVSSQVRIEMIKGFQMIKIHFKPTFLLSWLYFINWHNISGKKRKAADADDGSDASDDESDADSLLESGDDDEEDMSDADELMQASDDEDFEEVDTFEGMDDDFDFAPAKPKLSSVDKKLKKAKKLAASSSGELFASAEEFSALIDDNDGDIGIGGIDQVIITQFVTENFLVRSKLFTVYI